MLQRYCRVEGEEENLVMDYQEAPKVKLKSKIHVFQGNRRCQVQQQDSLLDLDESYSSFDHLYLSSSADRTYLRKALFYLAIISVMECTSSICTHCSMKLAPYPPNKHCAPFGNRTSNWPPSSPCENGNFEESKQPVT